MRILFTYENIVPTSQADAEVFFNTAAALSRRGHEATMVVPRPPGGDAGLAEEVRRYYELEGALRIETLPSLTFNLGVQHAFHAARLPLRAAQLHPDFVYTRNLACVTTCLAAGQKVFFDHYRPWGDQFPALQPLIVQLMTHPNFLGMVVHSEFSRDAYLRIGVPASRLRVAHNGFSPTRMEPRRTKAEARREVGLPVDRPTVVYTGRVNAKKGLEMVLSMARRLPEVMFVLVGSEGEGPIEREAAGMENVRIVGWQSFAGTAPYLYAADILIVPPSLAPLEQFGNTVLPLKLFLYLSAGRAILAADNPDVRELLAHDENAWLIEAGDEDGAVEGVRTLIGDPARLARLGEACEALAATLTWDARAEKIEAFFLERWAAERERVPDEGFDPKQCLEESAAWLRGGITEGRWVHRNDGRSDTDR